MSAQESLSIILNQPGFPRARPLSSDSKAGITEERATELINYQRNLEELRNTLSQVDSLLAEPPTPEIAAKCASLLGYVAAIDLPQEVKNQEAGRYPPQVQEQVHRALETQGTSTTRSAEAAAYGTAIMQRVAEEAQVRIQLEAKAAYEESRKVYEQQMQAYEMAFKRAEANYLAGPWSPENSRRFKEGFAEILSREDRTHRARIQNIQKNYPNMSLEGRMVVRKDIQSQRDALAQQIQDERRYIAELKEKIQNSDNPDEIRKYQDVLEVHMSRLQAHEVNMKNYVDLLQSLDASEQRNLNSSSRVYDGSTYSLSAKRVQSLPGRGTNVSEQALSSPEGQTDNVVGYDDQEKLVSLTQNVRAELPQTNMPENETEVQDAKIHTTSGLDLMAAVSSANSNEESNLESDNNITSGLDLMAAVSSANGNEESNLESDNNITSGSDLMVALSSSNSKEEANLKSDLKSDNNSLGLSVLAQVEEKDITQKKEVHLQKLQDVPNVPFDRITKESSVARNFDVEAQNSLSLKDKISENSQGEIQDSAWIIYSSLNDRSMG